MELNFHEIVSCKNHALGISKYINKIYMIKFDYYNTEKINRKKN